MSDNLNAISAGKRHADSVVAVSDARGWERPAEYGRLTALAVAAKTAAREAAPAPIPKPSTAAEVDKWLTATATARVTATARGEAAQELATDADRQTALLGQQLAVELIPRLVDEFDALARSYAGMVDAPRTITGYETDEENAAHTALLRCAADLATAAHHRGVLALVTGEADDIGKAPVWLVIAATARTSLDAVSAAVAHLDRTMPSTVEHWDMLVPLGLGLARLGEAPTRAERHAAALYSRGMTTPSGGYVDATYGEVEGAPMSGAAKQLGADSQRAWDSAVHEPRMY